MEPAFLRKPPFHSPVLETMQARSGGGLAGCLNSWTTSRVMTVSFSSVFPSILCIG